MYALDFEYDEQYLSDFGFMICNFNDDTDVETFSAGSVITFNKTLHQSGKYYRLNGTQYDECITATFNICKDPDVYDDLEISDNECRSIVRWLNRRDFLPFRLIYDEDDDRICWYDASFNIGKIKMHKKLLALELTMETNRPFGYGQELDYVFEIVDTTKSYLIPDMSDEIGYIYPEITITINESGDFTLYNSLEDYTISIKNCTEGEVITMSGDSLIIASSLASHEVYNDFNYEFFRIGNKYNDRSNFLTVNLQCTLAISYSPIIKDSPV